MNFKEALIAHLQGENVEARSKGEKVWESFLKRAGFIKLEQVKESWGSMCEFRLASRTIFVNGVEVPAGEKEYPSKGCTFYVPDIYSDTYAYESSWGAHPDVHRGYFDLGLVYLNKEDAIARAKAMLITN